MRKSMNKGCVIGFAFAVFAALAIAPRPSAGQNNQSGGSDTSLTNPVAGNNGGGQTGSSSIQDRQAYQQGYNQAYNQAYSQRQAALDNQNSQGSGGCCGGGSGGG